MILGTGACRNIAIGPGKEGQTSNSILLTPTFHVTLEALQGFSQDSLHLCVRTFENLQWM